MTESKLFEQNNWSIHRIYLFSFEFVTFRIFNASSGILIFKVFSCCNNESLFPVYCLLFWLPVIWIFELEGIKWFCSEYNNNILILKNIFANFVHLVIRSEAVFYIIWINSISAAYDYEMEIKLLFHWPNLSAIRLAASSFEPIGWIVEPWSGLAGIWLSESNCGLIGWIKLHSDWPIQVTIWLNQVIYILDDVIQHNYLTLFAELLEPVFCFSLFFDIDSIFSNRGWQKYRPVAGHYFHAPLKIAQLVFK